MAFGVQKHSLFLMPGSGSLVCSVTPVRKEATSPRKDRTRCCARYGRLGPLPTFRTEGLQKRCQPGPGTPFKLAPVGCLLPWLEHRADFQQTDHAASVSVSANKLGHKCETLPFLASKLPSGSGQQRCDPTPSAFFLEKSRPTAARLRKLHTQPAMGHVER